MPLELTEIEDGLSVAFASFLAEYAEKGGHRHHGFRGYGDLRNYQGPLIWSEGDCQFRLALALEKRFPGMVHVEVPRARFNVHDFDPKFDKRQFIDIVVSDLSEFDVDSDVFAEHRHDLFIEVKYVGHGTAFGAVGRRTIRGGVRADLERLQQNFQRGRCRAAAMLLIDDNSYLEGSAGQGMPWSPVVRPLLASPTQLARLKAAKTLRVSLPICCPNCGSPRVAPILWGMPLPEAEEAAARNEIVSGGCEMFGDGLDPTHECLDCGRTDARFDPTQDEHPPHPFPT